MFHIVLHQPEIPPNTGNIIRLCANTGCTLHLVKPLGFDIGRRAVRRAGLDYRDLAQLRLHEDLEACFQELGVARIFTVETGAAHRYCDAHFQRGDTVLFGSERRGLPQSVLERIPAERQLAIPMCRGNRSLNLSNAVALVVYEAWRQNDFIGCAATGFPP